MAGWNNDDSFGNSGFQNDFGSNSNKFNKATGFGGGKSVNFKSTGNSFSSNPRPTTNNSSVGWKPKIKDFEPVGNLNKMISVHNIPFFGQTQAFMGKTMWDWFKRSKAHFSDIIDRLNCHIVPMFLIFFVMLISANIFGAFGMEPMRCLRSPDLNEEEREYALDYCQSKNTYYVAPEEGIPWSNKERRERQLGYYHWVPIMMFLQALLFMLPNQFWNSLNQQSGIEFIKFIEESTRLKHLELNNQERPSLVRELSERMSEAILHREVYFRRRMVGCRVGSSMGSYVTLLYICIKFLYLVNVIVQFLVLNTFIGTSYRFWGWEVLRALINNENWQDSPIFPRLTLCDVPIRRLGDTPRYTLQCHLRINTYNEKIYLFIWWGFGVVAVLTFFNFLYYLIVFILPCTQESSVRHLLKQERHENIVYSGRRADKKLIKGFADEALAKDGVLLFWFIESHAGPIVARELLGEIFDYYKTKVHYEEDPEIVTRKGGGKNSFSSQSTGSLNDDDDWDQGGGGMSQRFGNGVTPSAPPKFSGESASYSSSQERELIDGEVAENTETSNLYASTPRGSRKANGGGRGGGSAKYKSRPATEYGGNDQYRRQPNLLTRAFRFLFGSGGNAYGNGGNNYYRNQLQQPPLMTPAASYYGKSAIKNV